MNVSIFAVHDQVLAVVGATSMRCTFLPDRHLQPAMARRRPPYYEYKDELRS